MTSLNKFRWNSRFPIIVNTLPPSKHKTQYKQWPIQKFSTTPLILRLVSNANLGSVVLLVFTVGLYVFWFIRHAVNAKSRLFSTESLRFRFPRTKRATVIKTEWKDNSCSRTTLGHSKWNRAYVVIVRVMTGMCVKYRCPQMRIVQIWRVLVPGEFNGVHVLYSAHPCVCYGVFD